MQCNWDAKDAKDDIQVRLNLHGGGGLLVYFHILYCSSALCESLCNLVQGTETTQQSRCCMTTCGL